MRRTLQKDVKEEVLTKVRSRTAPAFRQKHNVCPDSSEAQSHDSHFTCDTVTHESQKDDISSPTLNEIDVSCLPLPALPVKKRRQRLLASLSKHHGVSDSSARRHERKPQALLQQKPQPSNISSNNQLDPLAAGLSGNPPTYLSAFQKYTSKRRESLETSTRSFNEKLQARRMHYHMGGSDNGSGASNEAHSTEGIPKYLFGEHIYNSASKSHGLSTKEKIFLNKSGWVQVNTKQPGLGETRDSHRRPNFTQSNGRPNAESDASTLIRVVESDDTQTSKQPQQHSLKVVTNAASYAPKLVRSKGGAFIHNEVRLRSAPTPNNSLRPGYRIEDPHLVSIINERPGFLPVCHLNDADLPPPITPILSPPPAFQDSSQAKAHFERRKPQPYCPTTITYMQPQQQHHQPPLSTANKGVDLQGPNGKGMVFSRSFENDTRRPTPTADAYVEAFSISFDGDLSACPVLPAPQLLQRKRSPNFSTLTGNSPNYLTRKDTGGSSGSIRSRDSSPNRQVQPQTTAYLNTFVKEAPPAYSVASLAAQQNASCVPDERSFARSKSHNMLRRSRKSQFNRGKSNGCVPSVPVAPLLMTHFRSLDTTTNQRLNSCDSGARSDLSNDELDNDDDDGSSEFLSAESAQYPQSISPFKQRRQRSLTPDRTDSHSSSSSLRKQRALTPETRFVTPEDRRKAARQQQQVQSDSAQPASLLDSRCNTLECKRQHWHDVGKENKSRSSSSSSYSGGDDAGSRGTEKRDLSRGVAASEVVAGVSVLHRRRSLGRRAKQAIEHRIRRSRSLQLSENAANRGAAGAGAISHNCIGPTQTLPAQAPLNKPASNPHIKYATSSRAGGTQAQVLKNDTVGGNESIYASIEAARSHSFDFDYSNYKTNMAAKSHGMSMNSMDRMSVGSGNQIMPMRLDFDKSRSFEDVLIYRELLDNVTQNQNNTRYLKMDESSKRSGSNSRLRRTSPVGAAGSGSGSGGGSGTIRDRSMRSPQSSGSSCNNLNLSRRSTSPLNYGARLCDHELTYDMLRKSLDRSPIMNFRRGDTSDYEQPQAVVRHNRETINSGGNRRAELNFLSNDEHPTTTTQAQATKGTPTSSLKHQRWVGLTQSLNDSQYSMERLHKSSSRESTIASNAASEYHIEYQVASGGVGSTYTRPHHERSSSGNSHQASRF